MLGFGDAEDHGSDGYWRGDEERKAAATRGGRRSDGEVVEALVAEVDGEGLARRGRTRGAPTSGAEAEARGDVAMAGASQAWRRGWTAGELQEGRGWRWGWRCVSCGGCSRILGCGHG